MHHVIPKDTFFYTFYFFTNWSFIFSVFHRYTYKYVNLLYMSFITMFMGLYMSYINPRKFVFFFDDKRYIYEGLHKFILCDMIFHILVFILIVGKYASYYQKHKSPGGILAVLGIMVIYMMIYDIEKVYGIKMFEMVTVFLLANFVYFLLF